MRTMTQNELRFPVSAPNPVRPVILHHPRIGLGGSVLAGAGGVFTVVTLLLAAWGAEHGAANLLGALSWMSGVMLLALAVDVSGWRGLAHLVAGTLLLLLAWLASRVAPEFAMLSALVIGLAVTDTLWRLGRGASDRRFQREVTEHEVVLAGSDRAEVT